MCDFDNFVVATQPFYAIRDDELKARIENLETQLFWAEMRKCFFYNQEEDCRMCTDSVVGYHRKVYAGCKCYRCFILQSRTPPNLEVDIEMKRLEKGIQCAWISKIEKMATAHGLTFAPCHPSETEMKEYTIGFTKINMDLTVDADLCSGGDGEWEFYTGYGKRLLTDISKRKACIDFMNELIKEIRGKDS